MQVSVRTRPGLRLQAQQLAWRSPKSDLCSRGRPLRGCGPSSPLDCGLTRCFAVAEQGRRRLLRGFWSLIVPRYFDDHPHTLHQLPTNGCAASRQGARAGLWCAEGVARRQALGVTKSVFTTRCCALHEWLLGSSGITHTTATVQVTTRVRESYKALLILARVRHLGPRRQRRTVWRRARLFLYDTDWWRASQERCDNTRPCMTPPLCAALAAKTTCYCRLVRADR